MSIECRSLENRHNPPDRTNYVTTHQTTHEIWVYHSGEYLDCCLLGYDTVQSCRWIPTFRSNRLPLSMSRGFNLILPHMKQQGATRSTETFLHYDGELNAQLLFPP
jgi:hypothetical protein